MKKIILSLLVVFVTSLNYAQDGFESVIIEQIDASSVMDGATTYRVFVDLEDGYELQLIKGNASCDLTFSTTGTWYNTDLGGTTSENIFSAFFPSFPEIEFDSYVSMGGATTDEWAVLYADDTDGTVDGRMEFVDNDPPTATFVGGNVATSMDDNFGNEVTANSFLENTGGSYGSLTSNADIAPNNRIMVGQFTTDGEFSLAINIQIKLVGSTTNQTLLACDVAGLNYPAPIFGCVNVEACNYNADATSDDGSCLVIGDDCDDSDSNTVNDVVTADCVCEGVPAVEGCMDDSACNFDADANVDDGSCLVVGEECDDSDSNTFDDVVTADCICEGTVIVLGCMDDAACNFNGDANMDDGSCLIIGDDCDDGDANTLDDVVTADCICEGTPVGIEDLSGNKSDLMIYPNPAQNEMFLNFQLEETEQIRFEIFDISGKAINSTVSILSSGEVTHSLNTEFLEAGLYLLRISNADDATTLRFSIIR